MARPLTVLMLVVVTLLWVGPGTAQPGRDDMDQTIQEQLIVEFYSR